MNEIHLWTVVVAATCSLACAWVGVWLVLQRVSMIGDAISHSVLPGLVVSFLMFGTRAPWPMFLGAAVAGLATTYLTRSIASATGAKEDSSMGVVFTVLFALGVLLITRYARQIDLDPGCVLYGLLEFVALDTRPILGVEVPRALETLAPALALTGVLLVLFRKEVLVMAFDPGLARTLGFRPTAIYYGLMALVAVVTVASFEAVGSILVIAMLIGPAVAANLWTRNWRTMFAIASLVAVGSSVAGYALAVATNTSVAGMMAVAVGVACGLAAIFSPAGGVLQRAARLRASRATIAAEDLLANAYRDLERSGVTSLLGDRGLVARGWSDGAHLTSEGLITARRLVSGHRLVETFLVKDVGRSPDEVHESAHRAEHLLDAVQRAELLRELDSPVEDPHGSPIPKEPSA